MVLIKGLTMLVSFLYIPLLLNSLDKDEYAVWLTLTSLISMLGMFDIGLGNGLRNKLAAALANDDYELGRTYVSTAYVCIFILVAVLFLLYIFSNLFVNWSFVLNANDISSQEINTLVFIVLVSFLAQFGLGLINSVLYALQKPALSSLLLLVGQFLSLALVYILAIVLDVHSLLIIGGAISLTTPVVLLLSSLFLFHGSCKKVAPKLSLFKRPLIKEILSLGIKFFIIQIITLLLFQSNSIIIAHSVGNEAVIEYNIAYKYIVSLVIIFNIIATPMWSATTDAYEQGDILWIKKTNKALLKVTLLLTVFGLVMLFVSSYVYPLWLQSETTHISFITTLLLYLYSIGMMVYGSYGYIINGIGKLNIQIVCTLVISLLYIPISYIMGCYLGLSGVLIAFATSSFLNCIWSKIQYEKITNNKAEGIWNR